MQSIVLVDTFGFLFRSFYALPPLKNKEGFPTGLLMGFANLLMNVYKDRSIDYVIFALEGKTNHRKQIYPQYKATRHELPQDLTLQLPIAMGWIEKMGLASVSVDGYEADDVIASLSKKAIEQGFNVEIWSHDKDLYQLINEHICLFDPIKKVQIKEEQCFSKFGVYPKDFIEYQSLVGDSSDNVPGINGIGPTTAQKLIRHFGDLDTIYANLDSLDTVVSKKIAQNIRENKESAYLSKELVTLKKDLFETFDFSCAKLPSQNPLEKIVDDFEYYEFYKLLQRIKKLPITVSIKTIRAKGIGGIGYIPPSQSEFNFKANLITDEKELLEIIEKIPEDAIVAFDSETDSLDALHSKVVGFSFCFDGINGYYVPIAHNYLGVEEQIGLECAKKVIEKIFSHQVVGHNIKFDLLAIHSNFALNFPKNLKDTMILGWLIDSASIVGLDAMMERLFSHKMIPFEDVVEKGKVFSDVDLKRASEYASEDAVATYQLYFKLLAVIEEKKLDFLLELAENLEYPFIKILHNMEADGIAIDVEWFEKLRIELGSKISQKEGEIFTHANQIFNLNSPKQLSEVLFNNLKLRTVRQIKGGYSTDEQTLEEIYNDHPIVPCIMQYRELFKLKNTYVEPILKLKTSENKIHTSFLQTGTTTGRLSSKSPNLQNIPVRSDLGREIRRGFVATKGKKLLSVDYSQIELRLLAHFSKDEKLIEGFRQDLDIHLKTAEMIFTKDEAQSKRQIAKSINFGLIYGMGAKKLSQTLKIKMAEAREYIERYFALFPTVKNFLDTQKELILQNGYSQTLLGHRRYFNFQGITEFIKSNYLREGINSIFQGSTADLIKLSMLEIYKKYQNKTIKMLLQVHDELIFEVPEHEAIEVGREIEYIMNHIYQLEVPLKCGVNIGDSWADLK
ncbi:MULTISPECIES: DNA polymerase I [unclassified Helicobacter]|uniref:DNA polymerase I n=1 Tax=unclassified Helicobacter TaxID=2593540 RepID=UPI000CF0306B|nr:MULTISPECIES: DNA polymerase I [unclassified Helicobacter]